VHFVGLFLSSLLKMHGPKTKNVKEVFLVYKYDVFLYNIF